MPKSRCPISAPISASIPALIGALVAAAVLPPLPARAKCATPAPVLSATGAVPPDPVLYLFWPSRGGKEPPPLKARDGQGHAVPVEQTALEKTEAFFVYRIRLTAPKAGSLTLEVPGDRSAGERSERWALRVQPGWKPPPPTPAFPLEVQTARFRWTCSHQLSQNLQLPVQAAAFRVTIADSLADYQAGKTRALVLPYHMAAFFGHDTPGGGKRTSGEIQLGHTDCIGNTFVWPAHPIFVGVTALLTNGTEAAVVTAPLQISPPAPSAGQPAVEK